MQDVRSRMPGETEKVRARWNRSSRVYDFVLAPLELLSFSRLRKKQFRHVEGPRVLEVGVGTGRNFAYYPGGIEVVGIDFSEGMFSWAKRRALHEGIHIDLKQMDVQELEFDDDSFDTVVSTLVFCSVPDPVRGLREIRRVCRPTGKAIFLEHGRPQSEILGRLFDLLDPVTARAWGDHINRRTTNNIKTSGLLVEREESYYSGIMKLIIASPNK